MSEHEITIEWAKQGSFSHEGFNRHHTVKFNTEQSLAAAGANTPDAADPEQMLAASLASCHMQTFLVLSSKKRLVVESYRDKAVAELDQQEDGRFFVKRITLNPQVIFAREKTPDKNTLNKMHEKSHDHCFIANSIDCDVVINS